MRIIPLFLTIVLLFSFAECDIDNSKSKGAQEEKVIEDVDYIVSDYGFACDPPSVDSNLVLTPTRCEITIVDIEDYEFREQIRSTSKSKWEELLKSNSPEISQSASIWLYYFTKEKIEMFDLVLLGDSLNRHQKNQVRFWVNYFDKNHLNY